ncbi:MAG: antibiotic biosynthesis monooxygenase [Sulfurospirillaceae bacterium]|nr:antibiotic biosynthesis monooxygenase [Sulfurospirillaceae bacterium]
MSFVVVETYTYKKGQLAKLKNSLGSFLPILETLEAITNIEILEDKQNTKLLGVTTWDSKEAFDAFLRSPIMTQMLESEQMKEIQEASLDLDVQMYEKVELKDDKD